MKRAFFSVLVFLSLMSWAQSDSSSVRQVRPLPPITEVQSPLSSSDVGIEKVYVTAEPVEIPERLKGRLVFQEDFVAIEVGAMWEAIKNPSVPNSEKEIILVRYTMGDKRVDEVLSAARKAGIKTTVISDFNPIVKVDFQEGEKWTSDVSRYQIPKAGDNHSSWLANLIESGFQIGRDLFSQPIYNTPDPDDHAPIMHEKATLIRVGKTNTLYKGTGNLAANPRYNRVYKMTDELVFQEYYEHVQDLINVYSEGKPTSEIPIKNRKRIVYQDGTYHELAYTNGKLNPNNRIVDALTQNRLIDGTLSHFVITHRGFTEALEKAMELNKQARLFVVADDRFAELKGWGLAAIFEGIKTVTQFGRGVDGFSPDLYRRIDTFIYQRPALDPITGEIRVEYSQEGPPTARHVWHDKTSTLKLQKPTGEKLWLLFTGSFNLSNNSANAESQSEISLREGSWLFEATELSVRRVALSQPQWAVPAIRASIRNALANVFGLTDLEVPLVTAEKLEKASLERKFDVVRELLIEVSKIETSQSKKISQEIRTARLQQFLKFFAWYENRVPKAYGSETKLRHFLNIAHILGLAQARHYEKAMLIDRLLWRPGISKAEMNQLIIEGVEILIEGGQVFNDGTIPIKKPITKVMSFDFDDTIMRLDTKIILFSKSKPGEKREVSTTEFAEIRGQLGVSGEWADYEVRTTPNSFEYFRTTPEKHFVKDMNKALESGDESKWKTKQTDLFMQQLENKETADLVTIITARGHEREEILEGLKKLADYYTQKTGKKYFLPRDMNIYAVGKSADPAAEKAAVMVRLLDFLLKIGVKEWIFMDDDLANIEKMKKVFISEKNRWPSMKIDIQYTPYTEGKPAFPMNQGKPLHKESRGVSAPGSCRAALRMQAS
jgi:hypothetical protein